MKKEEIHIHNNTEKNKKKKYILIASTDQQTNKLLLSQFTIISNIICNMRSRKSMYSALICAIIRKQFRLIIRECTISIIFVHCFVSLVWRCTNLLIPPFLSLVNLPQDILLWNNVSVSANLANCQLIQDLNLYLRQNQSHSDFLLLQFFQELLQMLNTRKINVIHTRKAQNQTPLIWIVVLFQESSNMFANS